MLALRTAVLLAVWLGLLLVGERLSLAMTIAGFWWPWFFPLWFFLAMPAINAKNPSWRWAVAARGLMLLGASPLGDAVDPVAGRAIIAEDEADRTSHWRAERGAFRR